MDLLAYDIDRTQLPKGSEIFPAGLSQSAKIKQVKKKAPAVSVIDSALLRKYRCSKWKYRVRWCSSKAALLVLFWSLLLSFSSGSLQNLYPTIGRNKLQNSAHRHLVELLPYVSWTIAAPLSGWVADAYLGTYKVARIGFALLFLSTMMHCTLYQITGDVVKFDSVLFVCLLIVSNTVGLVGQATILVTLISLGLNQMPDASTANITSFIAWFICSIQAGYWLCDLTSFAPVWCIKPFINYLRIWAFFPALCAGIVCMSDCLLSPKWMIIEPKSPQSLLIIYQVLKFAAKHKSPLNRSALTYWEEDIPSRLDLGKSRYGGPFTTEQVEDVKTILRLLALSFPLLLIMVSFYLTQDSLIIPRFESCEISAITSVVFSDSGAFVLGTILYEFTVYPLISNLFEPSIIKRIGLAAFIAMLLNLVYLGLSVAQSVTSNQLWPWLGYFNPLITGFLKVLWATSILELLFAQSPYKMRGVVLGYFWFLNLVAYVVNGGIGILIPSACSGPYCHIVFCGVSTGVSLIGFALYCLLARWYKRRVRDDIATPHRWAEEVYDRYLDIST